MGFRSSRAASRSRPASRRRAPGAPSSSSGLRRSSNVRFSHTSTAKTWMSVSAGTCIPMRRPSSMAVAKLASWTLLRFMVSCSAAPSKRYQSPGAPAAGLDRVEHDQPVEPVDQVEQVETADRALRLDDEAGARRPGARRAPRQLDARPRRRTGSDCPSRAAGSGAAPVLRGAAPPPDRPRSAPAAELMRHLAAPVHAHPQRHLPGQAVRRAAVAGVERAERHLDHVEDPLVGLHCPAGSASAATFLVTIWMGALLLVVPTIRLALVQIAFSSQV